MIKDMTKGSPMKLILGFAFPMLCGMLFQQFYGMVDTVIVGRFLGVEELAAVGSTGSVNFLVIGFCMGVCTGFTIPVSHKFGAGDYVGMRKYVANCMWLSAVFAVLMTAVTTVLCRDILILTKTPENILQSAYSYIWVIFLGIPATYLYNMLSGVIRALGDSKTPVIFLVLSSFLNIVLDLFFIINVKMGVAGAAWATVISQGVSGLCCLIYMMKKFEILRIKKEEWKAEPRLMLTLCSMGVPMGLQYSITAIGSVILQAATNTLGSMAVASVTAGGRICGFLACPYDAMGSTMAIYGGQNMGAGRLDRIEKGMKACILLGAIYALIALGISLVFGRSLAMLFVEEAQSAVLEDARLFLILNTAFYFPLALVNIIRFLIQGMGFPSFAILAGVFEMAARTLAGFVLVPLLGFTGSCLGSPIAWIFADIFLIPAFFHVRKKCMRKADNSMAAVGSL